MRAAFLLPVLTASLRISGFQKTKRRLQIALANPQVQAATGDLANIMATTSRMVLAAARHSLFASTCMERSLALWWLLARQGIRTQLRIGVRTAEQKFSAHAWVEYEGAAVGEPEAPHAHYAAFDEEFTGDLL